MLPIDFTSSLQMRITGTLTGNGTGTYDDGDDVGTPDDTDNLQNVFLSVGDVSIGGSAQFALVKQTVERHRGTVNVSSAEGRGTTIKIALPTVRPRQAA